MEAARFRLSAAPSAVATVLAFAVGLHLLELLLLLGGEDALHLVAGAEMQRSHLFALLLLNSVASCPEPYARTHFAVFPFPQTEHLNSDGRYSSNGNV